MKSLEALEKMSDDEFMKEFRRDIMRIIESSVEYSLKSDEGVKFEIENSSEMLRFIGRVLRGLKYAEMMITSNIFLEFAKRVYGDKYMDFTEEFFDEMKEELRIEMTKGIAKIYN